MLLYRKTKVLILKTIHVNNELLIPLGGARIDRLMLIYILTEVLDIYIIRLCESCKGYKSDNC